MTPTLETVTVFAKRNVVPSTMEALACGDGRYTSEQLTGALRIFGGDMGALAAYWQAGREEGLFGKATTPEEKEKEIAHCVNSYLDAKIKVLKGYGIEEPASRVLYFHTDNHGNEAEGIYGCGHMKHLTTGDSKKEEAYGTLQSDMQELFAYVTDDTHGIQYVKTPLAGDHAEKTVILVEGENGQVPEFTIRSLDPETGDMNFVVDVARVKEYFGRLASALMQKGISKRKLWEVYERQQNITAGILAPNMPMVTVYVDENGTISHVADSGRVAKVS